jgi:peptidoglycan glycosyltransferase (EC 2.4.1.129)
MAKNILDLSKRKYVLGGIACGIILIYIIQLFNLQVLNPEYKDFADGNAFFNRTLYPARGSSLIEKIEYLYITSLHMI